MVHLVGYILPPPTLLRRWTHQFGSYATDTDKANLHSAHSESPKGPPRRNNQSYAVKRKTHLFHHQLWGAMPRVLKD